MNNKFVYKTIAQKDHIDILNHVNNEVYLSWFMSAAIAHSTNVGYSTRYYAESGSAFVVRRHEIDYLASAVLNDTIYIETWVSEIGSSKCVREYCMYLIDPVNPTSKDALTDNTQSSERKIIARAKTVFIYIDLNSGRPKKIPNEIIDVFSHN